MRTLPNSQAIVLLLVVFLSCSKKDDPKPVMTPPTAAFTFQVGDYGNVIFSNGSTNATAYKWSFGDGVQTTIENPYYVFGSANSFIVTLTATGDGGTSLISKTVTVAKSIVGIFTLRSSRVYNCENALNNQDLTVCPAEGCTEYEFTSTSMIVRYPVGPAATHNYMIVDDELKFVVGYTEAFLLSNFTGPELTLTSLTAAGAEGCRLETNLDR